MQKFTNARLKYTILCYVIVSVIVVLHNVLLYFNEVGDRNM